MNTKETPSKLTYRIAVGLVAAVRDGVFVAAPQAWLDRIVQYGWLKPPDNGFNVTEKGYRVLCPRENRAINFTHEPSVPFAVTTNGKQICLLSDYLDEPEPAA